MIREAAADRTILTARLRLVPLQPEDADEMVDVLGDERLHTFIGGQPATLAELRSRYLRLAVGHSDDGSQEWHNWIVRQAVDGVAVGTVQATITHDGRVADIAWVIGVPRHRQGYASDAAVALVAWLDERGVADVYASIHPANRPSELVAERAGLMPTGDHDEDGEQRWHWWSR